MSDYHDEFDGPGAGHGWLGWALAAACVAVPVLLALWAIYH